MTDKRPDGTGGLSRVTVRRGGVPVEVWRASRRVSLPGYPKPVRVMGEGPTPAVASDRLERAVRRRLVAAGTVPVAVLRDGAAGKNETVASWADKWLRTKVRAAPRTLLRYRVTLDNHLLPYLGGMPLRMLSPEDCDKLLHGMLVERGLSVASRQLVYAVLSSMMREAVARDYLMKSPMDAVSRPVRNDAGWNAVEARDSALAQMRHYAPGKMIAAAEKMGPVPYARVLLAFLMLRENEALGLRLSSVKLYGGKRKSESRLVIDRSLVRIPAKHGDDCVRGMKSRRWACGKIRGNACPTGIPGRWELGPTKSKKKRVIPVTEPLYSALVALRDDLRDKMTSDVWNPPALFADDPLLFCAPDGRPLYPAEDGELWAAVRIAARVPEALNLHAARHLGASVAARGTGAGSEVIDPELVRQWGGWSPGSKAFAGYIHSGVGHLEEPAVRLMGLLGVAADDARAAGADEIDPVTGEVAAAVGDGEPVSEVDALRDEISRLRAMLDAR